MKMRQTAWAVHKYLSYIVFAQMFLWVLGGVVFATVPFESLVKGNSLVEPPRTSALPHQLPKLELAADFSAHQLSAHHSAQGEVIKVQGSGATQWLHADSGRALDLVSEQQVAAFAQQLYRGDGQLQQVQLVMESQRRVLGLVDELNGRTGIWQARFDDLPATRLYFGARAGEYLMVRNDFWVYYDAFWRLHIMDYLNGEDFNNTLLRWFAWLAFAFVISGLMLSFFAARQQIKTQLKHRKRAAT